MMGIGEFSKDALKGSIDPGADKEKIDWPKAKAPGMKVLFQNRDPKSWIGGDMVQLDHTRTALEKLGIRTAFSSELIPAPQDIVDADIVHCFNFSMPWTKYHIWNAKNLKKKVVCSMIYHELDTFVDYPTQQAMMNELDKAIFIQTGELARAARHLSFDNSKPIIIANGIESWWFEPTIAAEPCDVLTVGRIDESKGQFAVAKACRKLGLHYRVIGEPSPYTQAIARLGAEILPPMTPKQLRSHYAACRVYALVSKAEVMPLTVMEAGAQAKNIVLTSGCEWDIPCERAHYENETQIESAIVNALGKVPNHSFRSRLQNMTWEKTAEELRLVYDSLCADLSV